MARPLGYWALVLHTHIPYVLTHGKSPHGTDWLVEGTAECYLPIYHLTHRLLNEGIPARYTIGFTPILQEQLAHPDFANEFRGYLEERIAFAREDANLFLQQGNRLMAGQAYYWQKFYSAQRERFEALNGSVLSGFRQLQDSGAIEVITSAGMHGYLPLLGHDECVRAQVLIGVHTYHKHFGRNPAGFWLPECAYRPSYRWSPPVGSQYAPTTERLGIEHFLAEGGIRYFFVDTHMIRGGAPLGTYWERFPALAQLYKQFARHYRGEQADRTPYQPYEVPAPSPMAVFARDPTTTLQVWSGEHGYPGDARYLEFHKQHYPGRLRYWRVSQNKADLGAKQPYVLYDAMEAVMSHTDHFVGLLKQVLGAYRAQTGEPGVLVSMYDTELFGHWWHEGPHWLYEVIRRIASDPDLEMLTCSEALEQCPPQEPIFLPEGSWGEGGYHYVWLNEQTAWAWEPIYRAEHQFLQLCNRYADQPVLKPYLDQLARELLLLQSSDWTFLITTQSARDYAEVRLLDHLRRFDAVARVVEALGEGREPDPESLALYRESTERDNPFSEIDLDWWMLG